MLIRPLHIAIAALVLATISGIANGKVYLPKQEALQLAFPGADKIETANLYLTKEEMKEVTRASGATVDSALYTIYVGRAGEVILGYATIEAATVRTLPETVMVVMKLDGAVDFIEILAFFEPEEYKPAKRWLDQFQGKRLSTSLRVGGDIQSLTGATLSAQAITRQVRKSSAMLRLFLERRP
ncbi:MAG: FMN-binding protein [Desulfuromonadales bacterium]|nr:FMN-binding protein [Desulfuromonadales bacterium]